MAESKKRERFTSPPCTFRYPWLRKPDSRAFKGEEVKPAFKVHGIFEEADGEKMKAIIDPLVEKAYEDAMEAAKPADRKKITSAYPYEDEIDDNGEETGRLIVKFKQNATLKDKQTGETIHLKIPLFGPDGKPLPKSKDPYGGTLGKVAFSCRPYFMASTKSAGVTMDLAACMILKIVERGEGSADQFGFKTEDGYDPIEAEDDEGFGSAEPEKTEGADRGDF